MLHINLGRATPGATTERPAGPGWIGAGLMAGAAGMAGAAATYLLDPDRGRGRRARLVNQAAGAVRRARRRSLRAARAMRSTAAGKLQAISRGRYAVAPLDDATLARKAETELFRDPSVPKGTINLNVEERVLVLRGEVPDAATRERVARAAVRVRGIWSVDNRLHLPGEPADDRPRRRALQGDQVATTADL